MIDIYGTLGPACAEAGMLENMLRLGMTGVRLNLSHMSLRQAGPMISALGKASRDSGLPVKLLIDMQGPELRIGTLDRPLRLRERESVSLKELGLPRSVLDAITPGQELLLDDGKLLLRAEGTESAAVERGGILTSRKSLALPGLELRLPALSKEDLENLTEAAERGVTGVMQPFVRSREDLEELRCALDSCGGEKIRIFAKIEDREGMERLPELMDAADEIVIARGDLGNAMPLWELPAAQKRIASLCRGAGKPFMVVTQMLASMEQKPVPTRAEMSDIFNAVLDGASSVMVTGETAVGQYPLEVIHYLVNTVRAAERYLGC